MERETLFEEWYYKKDGQTTGPILLDQLRELLDRGVLQPEQAVWKLKKQSSVFVRAAAAVDLVSRTKPARLFDEDAPRHLPGAHVHQ